MLVNPVQLAVWEEFTRIARVDIILDQVEQMLHGIDLPEDSVLWSVFLTLQAKNADALAAAIDNERVTCRDVGLSNLVEENQSSSTD